MAISLTHQNDQITVVEYNDNINNQSLTHTVGSGSNRVLIVLVGWENDGNETITSVVWDAAGANEALTEKGSGHEDSDDAACHAFYLVNPTAGTSKSITVTWDQRLGGSSGRDYIPNPTRLILEWVAKAHLLPGGFVTPRRRSLTGANG